MNINIQKKRNLYHLKELLDCDKNLEEAADVRTDRV